MWTGQNFGQVFSSKFSFGGNVVTNSCSFDINSLPSFDPISIVGKMSRINGLVVTGKNISMVDGVIYPPGDESANVILCVGRVRFDPTNALFALYVLTPVFVGIKI